MPSRDVYLSRVVGIVSCIVRARCAALLHVDNDDIVRRIELQRTLRGQLRTRQHQLI